MPVTPKPALADLRVLEWGDFISAPYAAKMMADMGADVIKIERPKVGDESRRYGPWPNDVPHLERSGLFLNLNTNKRSISADLETATGRDIFLELCKHADVLIENRHPSESKRLGLDYEMLREVNPRLIVTSVTVFGHTGPYAGYKGHALQATALSGVASRMGDPKRSPLTTPLSRGDYWGALNAAAATMTAVFARRKTSCGQHVDVSSAEAMSTLINALNVTDFVDVGFYPTRTGHRLGYIGYPWVILPVKDGYYSLITVQDRHWQRFVELIGNPEWSKKPRYQDRDSMGKVYPDEVDALIKPYLAKKTKKQLWAECRENKIPFHAVQNMADVVNCQHLKARDYFVEFDHPEAGRLKYPGAPYRFSKTPWRVRRPAPKLGQHNAEILCGLIGFSRYDLVDLRRTGII
ncbi:MAG: CoA transferase [Chloroflexi bacterium]|nr:CoA transferase [Chloroflexota bacterium]